MQYQTAAPCRLLTIVALAASLASTAMAQAQSPTPAPAAGTALGSAITYQGELDDASGPVAGRCDFQFSLYDALADGSQVGSTQTEENVSLNDGRFTVALDFGAVYSAARWLQIGARCPAGSGAWQTLSPRQPLTAVPAALSVPWSGITGLPAGFADGVDNDTTYTAGPGLALNGTQFSADTGVMQARVTGGCAAGQAMRIIAADGTVTCQGASAYTAGAGLSLVNGRFSVDATAVQTRIGGTCAVGSAVSAVNQDGTVVCRTDAAVAGRSSAALANTLTLLDDSSSSAGQMNSLTIGTDGLGLISYYDQADGNLKVAHCRDVTCSAAALTTVDSGGNVGGSSAIALGADGYGLISYYDYTNTSLKVVHCANAGCSTFDTPVTLANTGDDGSYSSLAIGTDGFGLISYYDASNTDLKVAHCKDSGCASADLATIDASASNDVGRYNSLAIGADGLGLISYYDFSAKGLKVAHCSDVACSTATLSTLDRADAVGAYSALALGADDYGLISYYDETNQDLKVAHCSDVACSSATVSTVDNGGAAGVGQHTSLTIGADGLGLISYDDATNGSLKVAHCSNPACTAATATTVDDTAALGQYTSITLGADSLGLISYYDATNGSLKVAHLGSAFGVPAFRRR